MSRDQWLQLNVALSRERDGALASARAVFAELSERFPIWRRQRAMKWFFFMRKPPDLRLRLLGPDPSTQLLPELRRILRALRIGGLVGRYFCSVYEPENNLFGGPHAMRLIHRHFDCDSRAWIELDRLSQLGLRAALPVDTIAMAVLNDLFLRAVRDRFEVWDVWRNLASLTDGRDTIAEKCSPQGIVVIESLLPVMTSEEARVLRRYAHTNQAVSDGFTGLWERGRLNVGLRRILPFVAMFDLNRHGYDKGRQGALAAAMSDAWDPRHGLHGVAQKP